MQEDTANPKPKNLCKTKKQGAVVTGHWRSWASCLQQQAVMWGRTQLLRDPDTAHPHPGWGTECAQSIRTAVFGSQGGSCPPRTPHSRQTHRPNTPWNHSPHGNTELVFICAQSEWTRAGPTAAPRTLPEHLTQLSHSRTDPAKPSNPALLWYTMAHRWHTPSTTET